MDLKVGRLEVVKMYRCQVQNLTNFYVSKIFFFFQILFIVFIHRFKTK